ncbi:MAG: ceramidase domain-containing protein [Bdellovibrionales bacterium]
MLNHYIDIYCERLEPGLWAEPLNALTNGAFIIAGFLAVKYVHQKNALNWRSGFLIAMIFAMGIGSSLFHTFATFWAMMSDVLPILAFQIAFIQFYAQRVMGMPCKWTFPLLGVFFLLMYISMQLPREWLNGTLEYAPALIFVTGFGVYHYVTKQKEKWSLLATAALFAISMTLRSIDEMLCEIIPFGTHFLWHCLNAIVLYLSARAYILNAK